MLTSAYIKEMGNKFGADLVGIASMDRCEGAPEQTDPRFIMPRAKSMIITHVCSTLSKQVCVSIYGLHNTSHNQKELDIFMWCLAGIQQIHAGIGA